jgi:hypothetical protein
MANVDPLRFQKKIALWRKVPAVRAGIVLLV